MKNKNGYRKEKMTPVPKGKRENGYRKEKKTPVPKEKRETGYRKDKIILLGDVQKKKIRYA